MAGMVQDQAFVSLATNNGYALGALVLGHSLRSVNTNRQLALMITRDVHPQVRQELLRIWDRLIVVNIVDSEDTVNLALLRRPDLGVTFTKLHAWKLTEYNKCVFLDADTFVLQNVDDLFDRPEISAAPDIGWPDCFNSGVFVFVPSQETHDALVAHALVHGSFDGGDQGLLNSFFSNWSQLGAAHRLPFTYNLHSNSSYTYSPAFKRFGSDVKIVHFLGPKKPWQYSINLETGQVILEHGILSHTAPGQFLQQWWDVYNKIAQHVIGYEDQMSFQEGRQILRIASDTDSGDSDFRLETLTDIDDTETYEEHVSPNTTPRAPQIGLHGPEGNWNINSHDHLHSISTQSTHSESHEINQVISGVGNLQFRNLADELPGPTEQNVIPTQQVTGRMRWEHGQIDYVGVDSFDNIQRRLDESLVS